MREHYFIIIIIYFVLGATFPRSACPREELRIQPDVMFLPGLINRFQFYFFFHRPDNKNLRSFIFSVFKSYDSGIILHDVTILNVSIYIL